MLASTAEREKARSVLRCKGNHFSEEFAAAAIFLIFNL